MSRGLDFHYISPNDIHREYGLRNPGTYVGGHRPEPTQSELDWWARAVTNPREVAAILDLLSTFRDGDGWTPLRWRDLQAAVTRANFQVGLLCEGLGFIDPIWDQYTPFHDPDYPAYDPPSWLRKFVPRGEKWQGGSVDTQWYLITDKGKQFLEEHDGIL